MKRTLLCGMIGILAACSGSPNATTGTGGSGGSGGTGGTGGAATSGTGATTGAGATGGSTTTSSGTTEMCSTSLENVYDNSPVSGLTYCKKSVGPLPDEDGTFAVTIFGPFVSPFTFESFTFAAYDGETTDITDPWTASVTVVPQDMDPLAVNPNDNAKPYPLEILETLVIKTDKVVRFTVKLDAPLSVEPCDRVVVALRNTVAPAVSAVSTCVKGIGSTHPETNQWWALNGTMQQMSTFSKQFDQDWWVSLVPAPAK